MSWDRRTFSGGGFKINIAMYGEILPYVKLGITIEL